MLQIDPWMENCLITRCTYAVRSEICNSVSHVVVLIVINLSLKEARIDCC